MVRMPLIIAVIACLFCADGHAVAASPSAGPTRPQEGMGTPLPAYPKAVDAAQFTQWFLATRQGLVERLKAARAKGDPKEVARVIAKLQEVRHHVVMELRRLEDAKPKVPVTTGPPASRPTS